MQRRDSEPDEPDLLADISTIQDSSRRGMVQRLVPGGCSCFVRPNRISHDSKPTFLGTQSARWIALGDDLIEKDR